MQNLFENPRYRFAVQALVLIGLIVAGTILKLYYSGAPDDEPRWLLAATAKSFSIASGVSFVFEPGQGYLSTDGRLLLYRGCSGLNFLVLTLCLVGLLPLAMHFDVSAQKQRGSPGRLGLFYIIALPAAGVATVLANVGRMLALLGTAPIVPQVLHPGAAHLSVGSFVYLVFLILFYLVLRLIFLKIDRQA